MSEPVTITVTAEYIKTEPDLQMRLFIRNLLASNQVSHRDKIQILRDEADRYEHMMYPVNLPIDTSSDISTDNTTKKET